MQHLYSIYIIIIGNRINFIAWRQMATICSWHWLHVRLYSLPLFILASSLHFFICSIFVFRFCSNHVGIAFGVINQFSSRSHTVQWFQLRSINSPIKIEKIEYEKMKWNIFNCHGIEITFVCRSWEERRDESHVFVFFFLFDLPFPILVWSMIRGKYPDGSITLTLICFIGH